MFKDGFPLARCLTLHLRQLGFPIYQQGQYVAIDDGSVDNTGQPNPSAIVATHDDKMGKPTNNLILYRPMALCDNHGPSAGHRIGRRIVGYVDINDPDSLDIIEGMVAGWVDQLNARRIAS